MLDDVRRFSTDSLPEAQRTSAWSEALAHAFIEPSASVGGPAAAPATGTVSSRRSSLESVFVRLASTPQTLVGRQNPADRQAGSVLVLALLEGRGRVTEGARSMDLSPGALVVLDPGRAWQVEFRTRFRAMIVRLESTSFMLRLVRTLEQDLRAIAPTAGVGSMCHGMIRSLADGLDHLSRTDLLAVEAALTDLLVICLSRADSHPPDTTSLQLEHLRRVCRTLEARLADPEFDLEQLARLEGLSVRYLQKLFRAASMTFRDYLKARRLERCRLDLANRALDQFPIGELCFRWGFGDAANFSRAFTARFGVSPKAYRALPARDVEAPAQRGRPIRDALSPKPPATMSSRASGTHESHLPLATASRRNAFADLLSDHSRYAVALALAPKRTTSAASAIADPTSGETTRSHGGASPVAGDTGRPPDHHYVPVSDRTVHWGFLSRMLPPVISIRSGDVVTIETLTQHATDDAERMIDGDPGAQSVFRWTTRNKSVDRRGAGPMDASIYGRGAGEGFGVHICTGPIHVYGAEPDDVLEVRILDIRPRPSCSEAHRGKLFGSNAAAWWGYQYRDLVSEPKPREVVTIYEIENTADTPVARALYRFRWTPQTDPFGVRHETIDYPGVPVDPATIERQYGILGKARIAVRPHFGLLAVAPREAGPIDSIPPGYFGGNLDNWRAGKGARLFLPIAVEGALFSVGDPHASQGDGEVCGTAIECSLTGVFQLVLHKRRQIEGSFLGELDFPFLETEDAWVVQGFSLPNHLSELGSDAQAQIYQKSSLDAAMRDAFRKMRRYLMVAHGLDEDEALSLMSVAVDFGITQVADGNWGVHAVMAKQTLPPEPGP